MLVLARTSTRELLYFEFGTPLLAPVRLEQQLRWILADFEPRRGELIDWSVTQSTGVLLDWLDEAGDDAGRLVPIIHALGFLRSPNTAPALEKYLAHPSSEVRLETIRALGRIGALESLPLLEPFLQSAEPDLRRAAIVALSKSLDPAMFPKLEAAAGANLEWQSLVRQGRRRLKAVQNADVRALTMAIVETEEYEDLLPMLDVTGEYVVEILRDPRRDLTVRTRALDVVTVARFEKAGPALAAILSAAPDPPDYLKQTVVGAGRCRTDLAVPSLVAFLDRPQPVAPEAVITSLGQIGSPRAIDPLIAKWNASGGALKERIQLALRRIFKIDGAGILADILRGGEDWRLEVVYFIDDHLRLSTSYSVGLLDNEVVDHSAEARRDAILLMAYLAHKPEAQKLAPLSEDQSQDAVIRALAGLAIARMMKEE